MTEIKAERVWRELPNKLSNLTGIVSVGDILPVHDSHSDVLAEYKTIQSVVTKIEGETLFAVAQQPNSERLVERKYWVEKSEQGLNVQIISLEHVDIEDDRYNHYRQALQE